MQPEEIKKEDYEEEEEIDYESEDYDYESEDYEEEEEKLEPCEPELHINYTHNYGKICITEWPFCEEGYYNTEDKCVYVYVYKKSGRIKYYEIYDNIVNTENEIVINTGPKIAREVLEKIKNASTPDDFYEISRIVDKIIWQRKSR